MLSKRRSSEAGDVVIKEGWLMKSPPPSFIFNNRTSWKERIHKLCKTFDGSYVIRYYSHDGEKEVWKGDIAVSSIQSIELGKASMDRLGTITQLLKVAPENVLCLNTTKRTYYFVDTKQENIVEWQSSITEAWVEMNKTNNEAGPRIAHPVPLISMEDLSLTKCSRELKRGLAVYRQPHDIYENPEALRDEVHRPHSYPQDNPRTNSDLADAAVRQRTLTDPQQRRESTANNQTERLGPLEKSLEWKILETCPEETQIEKNEKSLTLPIPIQDDTDSCGCRLSGDSTDVDTAYCSDPGSPIYDVPRPFSMANVSLGSTEDEEEEDSDSDDEVYVPMGSLVSRPDPQMPRDQPQEDSDDLRQDQQMPTDQSQEGTNDLRASEQSDHNPKKPPRPARKPDPNRKPKNQQSQLKKTYMIKMMFEQQDYVTTKITVPTLYLKNYFDIQEVGERLCVSKWKGPVEIGCLFHHGDHIDAINGVRPVTKDFFMQILNNSITEMVNLRIIRNKRAGVFHVPGCNCGNS
ncbi:pleckstrin homology domain-containing family S member 1 isoform X2 [Hyperolius riggenbachi]